MTPEREERLRQVRVHSEDGLYPEIEEHCPGQTSKDLDFLLSVVDDLQIKLATMDGCWALVVNDRDPLRAQAEKLREALQTNASLRQGVETLRRALARTTETSFEASKTLSLDFTGTVVATSAWSVSLNALSVINREARAALRESEGLVKP